MDKLNSKGIRFNEQEQIKIISDETQNHSKLLLDQIEVFFTRKYSTVISHMDSKNCVSPLNLY